MNQKTINKSIDFKGYGLHTGLEVNMKLCPSEPNTGIIFKRIDFKCPIFIKANLDNVVDTIRGTTIGNSDVKIHTVEHILSALNALGIDNVLIEIDNSEIPICDGSSAIFIEKILASGLKEFELEQKCIEIKSEINYYNTKNNSYVKILPYNGFKISFDIDFKIGSIGKQNFVLESMKDYEKEISKCRTFCTFNEISNLEESNLAMGGNLDNAIIFSDDTITVDKIKEFNKKYNLNINESVENNNKTINNKNLLFHNEPVRHKILDLIGDFGLIGANIKGHIISYKGGHEANIKLLKKINKSINKKQDFKFNKEKIQEIIPHRDPFLLIDEIIDGVDGKYVSALKYVNNDENYFQGHFPENPIMPGVLIIECMAQTSCFLDMKNTHNRNKKLMLLSIIKSAKFKKKVVPGDKLYIRTELLKYKLGTARVKGIAKVNNETVAEAEWMATMVERN